MNLFRTSLLSAVAVGVRILALLGINKLIAVYVGPSGYALVGQFQNALQIVTVIASGATTNGLVKYTAEYRCDPARERQLWATAGLIALLGGLTCTGAILGFSGDISQWLLGSRSFQPVVILAGICVIPFVANLLISSIVNGRKDVGRFVAVSVIGSILSLLTVAALAPRYGLTGALIALCLCQGFLLFATLLVCKSADWFSCNSLVGRFNRGEARKLFGFSLMALTSALVSPLVQLGVRSHVGQTLGWDQAGLIEAMWRFSAAYLMGVTATLSVYFLPRFSELQDESEIWLEVRNAYRWILPAMAVLGVALLFAREWIVLSMFDSTFKDLSAIMFWQIVGDFFKLGSWIISYIMLGKALVRVFIVSECLTGAFYWFLVLELLAKFSLEGVAIAHAVTYFVYWIGVFLAVRLALRRSQAARTG